jgi:formylglycine-generating enzyme required for sulfatase activity
MKIVLSLACLTLISMWPAIAAAQTVTCGPKEFRPSLVRIERPGGISGTGVVIIRRDTYAIVLTVKHVMPRGENFRLVFQAAPTRPVAVQWTADMLLAVPVDSDLTAFRIDTTIPKDVVPEDPFEREVPDGSAIVMWGYPSATGATLCSYESKLVTTDSGHLTIGSYVPEGVSGGPAFFIDPEDGAPKLAGVIVSGLGNAKNGTTDAIDIRQAVTIVSTSRDPRDGNRTPIWPNIQLGDEIRVDQLLSFNHVKPLAWQMGTLDGPADQRPPTQLKLPAYYMGKYEVTRGQFGECVAAAACAYAKPTPPPKPEEANLPVTNVTWYQANQFAKWLQSRLVSRRDLPRDLRRLIEAGWRIELPSEEEWERAARKNGTALFPAGNNVMGSGAWYNTGRPRSIDASKCTGCEAGLFDMAGNVREWTRSLKLSYPYDPALADKPNAPGSRAVRGGSYKKQPNDVLARQALRSVNRDELQPNEADEFTGFRVALICKPDGDRPCRWRDPD